MPQYSFKTREIGPNSKGSVLTFDELDNSLLFLSESVNETLSGSHYSFVKADSTPSKNGDELIASYNAALTPTNEKRYSILVAPGVYSLSQNLIINKELVDVVSLTGERDIIITGSNTFVIDANDVYVRGVDVIDKNFTITSSGDSTKVQNCKGGDYSFGGVGFNTNGTSSAVYTILMGTYKDCVGRDFSFSGINSISGIFEDCTAGAYSFGEQCFGSTLTNCTAAKNSFGAGSIKNSVLINCKGGKLSFGAYDGIFESVLIECEGNDGSFGQLAGGIRSPLVDCYYNADMEWDLTAFDPPEGRLISCRDNQNTITFPDDAPGTPPLAFNPNGTPYLLIP